MTAGRIATFYAATVGALLVALSGTDATPLRLVFNASASLPLGWYRVGTGDDVTVGDLVVVQPPPEFELWLAARGYLAEGVPLLKAVAARDGARVCRDGDVVTIDAEPVGRALERDRRSRPLPAWKGCHVLTPGQVFLLNRATPESLDGRYFGPTSRADIVGKATPLWTW